MIKRYDNLGNYNKFGNLVKYEDHLQEIKKIHNEYNKKLDFFDKKLEELQNMIDKCK